MRKFLWGVPATFYTVLCSHPLFAKMPYLLKIATGLYPALTIAKKKLSYYGKFFDRKTAAIKIKTDFTKKNLTGALRYITLKALILPLSRHSHPAQSFRGYGFD